MRIRALDQGRRIFNKRWPSTNVSVRLLTGELFDLHRWVPFSQVHPASSRHLFVHKMS